MGQEEWKWCERFCQNLLRENIKKKTQELTMVLSSFSTLHSSCSLWSLHQIFGFHVFLHQFGLKGLDLLLCLRVLLIDLIELCFKLGNGVVCIIIGCRGHFELLGDLFL
jgi:hypothetical protein